MIFKKSISTKFVVTVFLVLLIGQLAGTLILFFYTKSSLYDSLEKRMQRSANIIAGVSSGPLLSYDYALVDMYLEEFMRDEDIMAIHILESKGKIVREKVKAVEEEKKSINPFMFKGSFEIIAPVTVAGEKLGDVHILFSGKTINQQIAGSMTVILLFQGIILLLVSIVMMFLFSKDVIKPVSIINSAIAKISKGELTTEVPDLGKNEIGSIAKGVAFLKERLSLTIVKLNSTAVNVSMAIQQVHMLYKNVTDGIIKESNAIKNIIKSIQNANKSHADIINNTEKFANFSSENVSSLLQMKASAEEIAVNTLRLYKATEDSYSVVVQMTQSAKAISSNSHEIVTAVENTSAYVEEVGASIKEVEGHARDSSKMAEKVNEIISDIGMLSVVNAIEGMDKISDEVKNSAAIIQRLGTRSLDIEKMLSVIKDVTEQTNLLSLNAAILAAQAGEYGKSFSVVAEEIRALSERTASSTMEIAGVVKTIQKDIKDAVRSIDNVNEKAEEGNVLVISVGDALKEILTASEHSTNMTKAIERATEEQSVGLKQIVTAVEDVRKMMSTIAKSTSEQEKSLGYLLAGAGEVKEVADVSKRGTGEQAVGTKIISKNLELANDKIAQINQAIMNQKKLNDEIILSMEQINTLGASSIKDMDDVSRSLDKLFEEIAILKTDMEVFKIK